MPDTTTNVSHSSFLTDLNSVVMACGVIRVYAGEGSTRRGVLRLCSCLKQLLEDKLYNIQTVMPAELIKGIFYFLLLCWNYF